MDAVPDIVDKFPSVLPLHGEIRVENETHTYEEVSGVEQHVYLLNKAPIIEVEAVSGTSGGSAIDFVGGLDFQVVDDNNDGQDDSIEFGIGGNDPDVDTDFEVTYRCKSILQRYVESHDDDVDDVEDDMEDVLDSIGVDTASGGDLERVGALFGELGRRRDRNDEEYRALIKSIVQSFAGRGTKPGLKFAIAAGIGTTTDNVTIQEDFDEVGYSISIDNVDTSFLTATINDMAELADPSGVELLGEPFIAVGEDTIVVSGTDASVASTTSGLGSGTLSLDGGTTLPLDSTTSAIWDTETWGGGDWDE